MLHFSKIGYTVPQTNLTIGTPCYSNNQHAFDWLLLLYEIIISYTRQVFIKIYFLLDVSFEAYIFCTIPNVHVVFLGTLELRYLR